MNKRFASVFVFAVAVAAIASLIFYRMIARVVARAAKPSAARVLVAARTLPLGTLIRDMDVKQAEWTGPIPAQAVTTVEDAVNRGVIAEIYEGEPIVQSRLAPKGAGAGLGAIIPQGMRAVAVRVNDVVGVAGFVVPGMRVDVLIFGQPPNGNQSLGTRAKTILQNMEVLSAGQNIQKDAEGKPVSVPVVNVLATPEQAEILSLASNDARIQLVLRNPLDTKEAKTPGTAIANLFSGERPAAPEPARKARKAAPRAKPVAVAAALLPPPKPEPIVVEVLNGGTKTEAKFLPKPEVKP
ncbi:MAG: Flp pilus assembly protein CpaB [Acidobacteriota bacterium]